MLFCCGLMDILKTFCDCFCSLGDTFKILLEILTKYSGFVKAILSTRFHKMMKGHILPFSFILNKTRQQCIPHVSF